MVPENVSHVLSSITSELSYTSVAQAAVDNLFYLLIQITDTVATYTIATSTAVNESNVQVQMNRDVTRNT